jgi:anti-sigma factor RsiW
MTSPNEEFDDELLSAYIDGELTALERARVEERLKSDPRAARLVEELRSLGAAIRSLPREPAPPNLRANVEAAADATPSGAGGDVSVLPMTPPYDRWAGYRRGLAWSAVAIAATLVLMAIQPEEANRDEQVVAKAEPRRRADRTVEDNRPGNAPRPMGEMRAPVEPEAAPAESSAGQSAPTGAPAPRSGGAEGRDSVAEDRFYDRSQPARDSTDRLAIEGENRSEAAADAIRLHAAAPADRSAATAEPPEIELLALSPESVAKFEQILTEHGIALQPEADDEETGAPSAGAPASLSLDKAKDEKLAEPQVERGLVEATAEQLDAVLEACLAQRSTFVRALAVDDSGAASASRALAVPGEGGAVAGGRLESSQRRSAAGGFGGGGAARPNAAGGAAAQAPSAAGSKKLGAEPSGGKAWRLAADGRADAAPSAARAVEGQAATAAAGAEGRGKEPARLAEAKSSVSSAADSPQEAIGDQVADAPQPGHVRAVFILRPSRPAPP